MYCSCMSSYLQNFGNTASLSRPLDTDENPIIDVSDRLPITTPYNDEIYLSNRILAFERDGSVLGAAVGSNFRRTTSNQSLKEHSTRRRCTGLGTYRPYAQNAIKLPGQV